MDRYPHLPGNSGGPIVRDTGIAFAALTLMASSEQAKLQLSRAGTIGRMPHVVAKLSMPRPSITQDQRRPLLRLRLWQISFVT